MEGALAFRRGVLRDAGGSRKLSQLGAVMGRVMQGETLSGRLWGVGRGDDRADELGLLHLKLKYALNENLSSIK